MKLVRGLLAILALLVILAGAPWLLLQLGQMPGFLPVLDQLPALLLRPDSGRVVLVLVWAAAWVLWLWLAGMILVESIAAARGIRAPKLPGASIAQPLVRALVTAAAALIVVAPTSPATAVVPMQFATPIDTTSAVATRHEVAIDQQVSDEGAVPAAGSVVVARGDTLWDLAQQHLGDPLRWAEIFELNKGVPQPAGYTLQDPDAIDVGWTLLLPSTPLATPAPAPAPAAPSPGPDTETGPPPATQAETAPSSGPKEAAAPGGPTAAPATPAPMARPDSPATTPPAPTEAPIAASASAGELDTPAAFRWEVAGLLGAGSFLGVGVAALLTNRRREQFRTRRPGRSIATPEPATAPIEKTARLATGLSARLVERLDQVLRRLQGSIALTAVLVARDGTIDLITDDELPAPWQPTRDGWKLANSTPVDQVGENVADQPCGYPLMVTIGTDINDHVVLLNLETIGVLTIAGDPIMTADFTRYLAAELAVNPWSNGVRVSCRGAAADVIAMAPDRLDAQPAEVWAIANTNQQRATGTDLPFAGARVEQAGDETWAPGVAFAADPTTAGDELAGLIAAHPGHTGTAIVAPGLEQPVLTLSSSGRVRWLGMELTAVGLTEDEAAGCAALLAATEAADVPPTAADDLVDVTGNLLPEHRLDRTSPGITPVLPEPDETYLADSATVVDDLVVLAPRVPERVAHDLQDRDPNLDADVTAWFSDNCPYPRLALLGPVTARCYGKPIAKQKAYYTEALAYLALHPDGVTGEQVADAFGISVPRARTVISNLRQWVGTNPRTRTPLIPDAKSSPQAQTRGIGLYLVEDLLLDIDLFRRLRTRALAKGPAGIPDLTTALELVAGRPFDQLRPAGWTWLLEGDRIDHHMTCAIGDVAHILVTHHLQSGDLEAARQAATVGLQADPDSETARLDLAAIMVETGHSQIARQALTEALGETADLDLSLRGTRLTEAHGWMRRRA